MSRRLGPVVVAAAGVIGVLLTTAILGWHAAEALGLLTATLVVGLALDMRRRTTIVIARITSVADRANDRASALEAATATHYERIASDLAAVRSEVQAVAESTSRIGEQITTVVARTTEAVDATEAARVDIVGSIASSGERVARTVRQGVSRDLGRLYQQLEAMLRLRAAVDAQGMTPPTRGWAASPDVIALLVTEVLQLKPSTVLECGSGASTVWLAMAIRAHGLSTRVVALEHEPVHAEATRRALIDCGVADIAEVRVAPLIDVTVDAIVYQWYDPERLAGLADVGVLFVDGPPGGTGPNARMPALPLIYPLLAPAATIVLDDTVRDEEKSVAAAWASGFPDFDGSEANLEKGAWILRRRVNP